MTLFALAISLFADDTNASGSLSLLGKILFGVGLPGLCTATWFVATRYYRGRVNLAERKARQAEASAESATDAAKLASSAVTQLQVQLNQSNLTLHAEQAARHGAEGERNAAKQELIATQQKLHAAQNDYARAEAARQSLQQDLANSQSAAGMTGDQLSEKSKALARLEKRMRSALKLEGQLWNAKALQARPKFRDLARRQRAIISVLNLKGGVGKTTVTAHLGAALARRGYRVLLIDLDLQGSLSSMLIEEDKLAQAYADRRFVQHFFQHAASDKKTKITDYALEVWKTDTGALDVVCASDNLAYAELNLTMRWLLGSGNDTRFLLRKALHLMSVSDAYDIVLIDCPPLVNISCVNALAASDYVLVPTTLSRKSLDRVPKLIQKLLRNEQFVKHLNPRLQLLGLLANRTLRTELTGAESDDWDQVADWCRDAYGQPITRFQTTLPQMRAVDQPFSPDEGGRPNELFTQLALEIEGALPRECRRAAKASS